MILDFKEIPEANKGGGLQDSFELFAREFLHLLGYFIVEEPNRGADGGKDFVVLEKRQGVSGESEIKWLVSCKHHAHSRASVSDKDELDIYGRVHTHQ